MNATELRVGNLVYRIQRVTDVHTPIKLPMKIEKISRFEVDFIASWLNPAQVEIHAQAKLNDICEIELSEEWLISLGLERKSFNDEYRWITKHYMFLNPEFGWSFKYKSDGFISFYFADLFVRELRYVHQLQNFYFALTSEELINNYKIEQL